METRISRKTIDLSDEFKVHRTHIYNYTIDQFGYFQAERYMQKVKKALETLFEFYLAYPECRHIMTKSRMYRNIILDAHLIIYRITDERIEVLDIIHAASSISKIRGVRNVRL
jgi:plasmid stabilization system protein ParE